VYPDWKGEYWPNRDLSGAPALVRNDPAVNYDWASGSPDVALPNNNYSARWTRTAHFHQGTYRFHALADDGVRLWVDDRLVIDAWYDHSAHELMTDRALTAGTHSLKVEYYEHGGDSRISVWWEKVAYPSYPDWKGEYWSNRDLSGDPALVRNDRNVNYNWGADAASPGLPVDDFSARWTRQAYFEAATYRFHALVDDGVRLWVDGQRLIDAWYDHTTHELVADYAIVRGTHNVRVEYYEQSGDARIQVWWEKRASPSYPDWKGEYWSNRDLSGDPALVRNDRNVDFDWKTLSPAAGLPADSFSARWTRRQTFQPGVYRFYAWADDSVRAYVDGRLVVDEWHGNVDQVYIVDLPLEGTHRLAVEYGEHTGDARVRFWWQRLGDLPTPTPTATQTSTLTPTTEPTATPTTEPTATPTTEPTATPTPTTEPTATPTTEPTATPTTEPTATPTTEPTVEPSPSSNGARLNEVLPVPGTADWDGDGNVDGQDEWIELYNGGEEAIDLGGWLLDSASDQGALHQIPYGTVLGSGEFLVLYRQQTGIALDDEGGEVQLLTPEVEIADAVTYGEVGTDASYSRDAEGAWYVASAPSPGEPNGSPFPED
jgi:hypothetical protein